MDTINILTKQLINNSTNNDALKILFANDNMEVMQQFMTKNATVWIEPAEDKGVIEFFYIISGKIAININNQNSILSNGECFYVADLTNSFLIDVIEDTTLIYICNHPLFNIVSTFQDDLNKLIMQTDDKDHYTAEHSQRVAKYIRLVYELLKDKYPLNIEHLVIAGLFHDIGKCELSDEIIKKRSNITADDMLAYQKHVEYGARILEPIYGKRVSDLVLHHHELLNGTGYLGLKDSEIDIETRILICCDAFDDLISYYDSYAKDGKPVQPLTKQAAIMHLISKPYLYDIDVVNCLKILNNQGKLNLPSINNKKD